jgi:Mor family transcriptional regulator
MEKVAKRRSDVDLFEDSFAEYSGLFDGTSVLNEEDVENIYNHPLSPLKTTVSDKCKATIKHLCKKYKDVSSLHIKTICRSAISVQQMYTSLAENDAYCDIYGNVKAIGKMPNVC